MVYPSFHMAYVIIFSIQMHPLHHQQHVGAGRGVGPGSDHYRPPHPSGHSGYPSFSSGPGQSNRPSNHTPPASLGHGAAGGSAQYPLHHSFHGPDMGSHNLSSSHNHQAAAGK